MNYKSRNTVLFPLLCTNFSSRRLVSLRIGQGWAIAHSLIRSWFIFALFKRAIVLAQIFHPVDSYLLELARVGQLLIPSFAHGSFMLFSIEQLCDRSLICSLKWAIALFVALCKSIKSDRSLRHSFEKNEWAIAFSKRGKEQKISEWAIFQIPHFSLKKRVIAHFQNSKWTNAQLLIYSFVHRSLSKEQLCDRSLNRS